MENDLPSREELLELQKVCERYIEAAEAIERWKIARQGVAEIVDNFPDVAQGVAEIVDNFPDVAQALVQGKPFQEVCSLIDEPPGPGAHHVLEVYSKKNQPERGRGRPRSRKLLSIEEQNKIFLVYKINLVCSADPEKHLARAIQKAPNPFVRQFLQEVRPLIRFNLSHRGAVRHCSEVFGIGQRHVREIIAGFNKETASDELFQAVAELARI